MYSPGRHYRITTDPNLDPPYQNWYTVHKPYMFFDVMTSTTAIILLAKVPGNTTKDVVEVIIGDQGNTMTTIRENGLVFYVLKLS
jgi:hypothetical protein